MNKICYCEIGFLKEFFNSRPIFIAPTEDVVQLLWVWTSLYKFISKASLFLDISHSEFKQLLDIDGEENKNENFTTGMSNAENSFKSWLRLINKSEGAIDFTEENDSFPKITDLKITENDNKKLNAVYLTTLDDDVCKKQSRLKGVIVLNNNLARECSHLFNDNGHAIPSEVAQDWGFLKKIKYPSLNICNSIVIVDNYLFINDENKYNDGEIRREWEEKIEHNLHPILQAILPDKLDEGVVFEIAIFTSQDKNHPHKSFESQYQNIINFLSFKRKKLNYRISFYGKCHEAFHDRCILTNNVWISSGRGFDIFGRTRESDKPTSINIVFPFIQSSLLWCDHSYLNVLSQADKIIERFVEPNINYWGDENRHNRIVSHFIQKEKNKKTPYKNVDVKNISSIHNAYYQKRDKNGTIIR